jgi:hypothetical protein
MEARTIPRVMPIDTSRALVLEYVGGLMSHRIPLVVVVDAH